MKKNLSNLDRIIRAIVALLLVWLNVSGVITGNLAIVVWVIVIVLLGTVAIGYCHLYKLLGITK